MPDDAHQRHAVVWPKSLAGLGLIRSRSALFGDSEREVKHHMGDARAARVHGGECRADRRAPRGQLGPRAWQGRDSHEPARKSAQVTWSGARLFTRDGCRGLDGESLDFLMEGDHDVEALFDTALAAGAAVSGGDGGDKFKKVTAGVRAEVSVLWIFI